MRSAISHFVFVTLSVLFVVFFSWFYFRQKGLSQPTFAFDHPFLRGSKNLLVYKANSDSKPTQPSGFINWIDIDLENPGEGLGKISALPKDSKFILNLLNYPPNGDLKLQEAVNVGDLKNRALILSPVAGLLSDLRKLDAGLLFGNSATQNVQLQMLSSIGLAPAAKLKSDVFVAYGDKENQLNIDDSALEEVVRRKIPVIAGPITDQNLIQVWRDKGISGFISPSIELLKSLQAESDNSN